MSASTKEVMVASLELVSVKLSSEDGRSLLHDVNARFDTREFTVVAGLCGSGKTSLARVLGGMVPVSSGDCLVDGRRAIRAAGLRPLAGMVPQLPSEFMIGRTVRDELFLGAGSSTDGLAWLAWAQLDHLADSDPRQLSFGEQRRLAIATACAAGRRFLLLDDPFQGLDHAFIPRLIERLLDLHREGKGIIVFTNEIEKILAHADRLVVLKGGRIIADALPERVLPYLDAHGFRKPAMKLSEMTWLKAGS